MKIAHIVWGMSTGGIETMLTDIIEIQSKNNNVCLITINNITDSEMLKRIPANVSYYNCQRRVKSKNPFPIIKLNFFIWKEQFDIVHLHYADIAKLLFVPVLKVCTIHSLGVSIKYHKRFKAIYAISKAVNKEWKNQGIETILIENGIPIEAIKEKTSWKNEEPIHIVQVSRLEQKRKAQDLLIEAVLHLNSRKKIKIHLIGEGPDRKLLEDKVAESHLGDIIVFEGLKSRDWLYNNLCIFDLYVHPARSEGFGLTVAEACAAMLPVIVSENDGPFEILENGTLGMTFKNGDVHDLAKKIDIFLDKGYDMSLLEKARKKVLLSYNIASTANKYLENYNILLNSSDN